MLQKIKFLLLVLAFLAYTNTSFASVTLDLSTGVNVGLADNPLYSITGRDDNWFVCSTPALSFANTNTSIKNGKNLWNSNLETLPIYANKDNALAGGMIPAMTDCKNSITGKGTARNNETLAKSRAKEDWRDKAGNAHGLKYQHWMHSLGQYLTCSRSGGVGNRTWNCEAISQPCLL